MQAWSLNDSEEDERVIVISFVRRVRSTLLRLAGTFVRRLRRYYRRALIVAIVTPLLAYLGFRGAIAWWPYPAGIDRPPASSLFIDDRSGTPLAALVAADGQWCIPLADEQLSPHLLDALVAVEDGRFYSHSGVDWRSVAVAAWQDVRSLHIRRGASTLTMQVQRLRDPKPRSFYNKFEQAVRAEQLESRQNKRQTLVEYANRAPFGGNLVGAGAASWRYFGRPCSQISLAEAALLAGLPQSPSRLRPDRFPVRAMERRNHVLDRMLALAMIDKRQHDEACGEPVTARWLPLPQDRDGQAAVADSAMPTLAWLAMKHPGSAFHTTLDAGTQRQAARATFDHLAKLESSGVTAAAVVVLDTETSECLAAVSLSRGSEQVDLTRSPRSTGSTLKPFIYAAAFQAGSCTPQTVLEDAPIAWAGYEPADYDRKFRGSMTAADALAQSRNIPAMVVLARVGVESAVGVMDAAGLKTLARSPQRYGLSLAIGGAEATPMELAQAYAMLGRGGIAKNVTFAEQSVDIGGEPKLASCSLSRYAGGRGRDALSRSAAPTLTLPRSTGRGDKPEPSAIIAPSACWQTLIALSNPDRTASVCPGAVKLHVAWKTGTSNGHRDAWCAAVTRHRTIIVWLGNAAGQASPALVGGEAAAPLALRLISILDPVPGEPWPVVPVDSQDAPMHQIATTTLSLVSPVSGTQFVLDPDSPRDHQRVLLKASLNSSIPGNGTESRTLWWFVDSQPVGVADADTQLWWQPQSGIHEVRAVDAHGHAAVAQVIVR